jgi:hypothetical protein
MALMMFMNAWVIMYNSSRLSQKILSVDLLCGQLPTPFFIFYSWYLLIVSFKSRACCIGESKALGSFDLVAANLAELLRKPVAPLTPSI